MCELSCPFCEEDGFDEIGLKAHLLRWCERFDDVITPEEEKRRQKVAGSLRTCEAQEREEGMMIPFPHPQILYCCRGVGCGLLYEADELYFWSGHPDKGNGSGFYCSDCLLQMDCTEESINGMRKLEEYFD